MSPRAQRSRSLAAACAVAASVLLALLGAATAGAGTPPPGFIETQVVDGSSAAGAFLPTAIAYEPGSGNLWILEKGDGSAAGQARVRVRNAVSGTVSTALILDCVDSRGERGFLGVAISPDFLAPGGQQRHVYLYYTPRIEASGPCAVAGESAATRFRVSRFTESGSLLSGEEVILEGPDLNAATNHNAGAIQFAPDGTLFVATGDNDTDTDPNPLSRDLGDLRGKLLRIERDGAIPVDNPLTGQPGARSEIWAWGLRNPFRFRIDSESGTPIIADVGQATWEAIYVGVAGADYGYPCFEGSAPLASCNPIPPAGTVTAPAYEYGHGDQTPPVSGRSVTGGPVYRGTAFPEEYEGSYFFGDYVAGWIRRGRLTSAGRLEDVELFMADAPSVVDLAVSPDGCLAWVRLSGEASGGVREVCYAGGGNGQPRAVASASPVSGLAPLTVQFTGSASTDPDFDPLAFSWDLDDSAASSDADPSHQYSATGVYHAWLGVDDQQGAANSHDTSPPLRIVVGNRAPMPSITLPAAGSRYDAGETIFFAGGATDPEEGSLGGDRLAFTVVFHHGTHTHPFLGPITGVTSGSFQVPTSGESATDVFFRVHLSATDSGAPLGAGAELTAATFVDVVPNVAELTLVADPAGAGIELELDRQPAVAPAAWSSVVGFPRTLGAPTPQVVGPETYFFQSWSDAGAAEHEVATPATDTTYTATYAPCTAEENERTLSDHQVIGPETESACLSILVEAGYQVQAGGDLTLIAAETIVLGAGFSVVDDGRLTVILAPPI